MIEKSAERVAWLDTARITAICFVVMIHTAGSLLGKMGMADMFGWHAGNIFDSAVRSGVPLFIMVSGALLIPKRESIGQFYKKRFLRILLPYITWSFIYILFRIKFATPEGEHVPLKKIAYAIYSGNVFFNFQFINYFIGIYLFAPFIRTIAFKKEGNDLYFFALIWSLLASFFPMLDGAGSVFLNNKMKFFIDAPQFTGFIGFFVLGYLVAKAGTRSIHIPAICFFIFFLVTACGTFYLSRHYSSFRVYFYDYASINVIGMSVSVFLLIRNTFSTIQGAIPSGITDITGSLSDMSYGVYFFHIIALYILQNGLGDYTIHASAFNPFMAIPLTALTATMLSFSVLYVLCRIPHLKRFIT